MHQRVPLGTKHPPTVEIKKPRVSVKCCHGRGGVTGHKLIRLMINNCLVMWHLVEKPTRQTINEQSVLVKKITDIITCPPSSTSMHRNTWSQLVKMIIMFLSDSPGWLIGSSGQGQLGGLVSADCRWFIWGQMVSDGLTFLSGSWQAGESRVASTGTACVCSLWCLTLQSGKLGFLHWEASGFQRHWSANPCIWVLRKPFPGSCLLMSLWRKQVTWSSPVSESGDVDKLSWWEEWQIRLPRCMWPGRAGVGDYCAISHVCQSSFRWLHWH